MAQSNRHNLILEIIKENEIDTQEELVHKLYGLGCDVTQATVSRDIKQLQLIKTPGTIKKYRYTQVNYSTNHIHNKFGNIFKESVLHIQVAGNIIVVKTVSGGANSAAAFIDNLNITSLLGCIAGDDTIFSVATTSERANEIAEKLKGYF